jgi:hypothetical protein
MPNHEYKTILNMVDTYDKKLTNEKFLDKAPNIVIEKTRESRNKIMNKFVETCIHDEMRSNPHLVAEMLSGNKRTVGTIVAIVMGLSKGKASPQLINQEVAKQLQALREKGARCSRCEGPKEPAEIRIPPHVYWACEDCKDTVTLVL